MSTNATTEDQLSKYHHDVIFEAFRPSPLKHSRENDEHFTDDSKNLFAQARAMVIDLVYGD